MATWRIPARVNFSSITHGGVVDASGNLLEPQITLPQNAQSITVATDGTVSYTLPNQTQAQTAGQIQLATFINPAGLNSLGQNLYQPTTASGELIIGTPGGQEGLGTLLQGYTEQSNVSVVEEMVNLIVGQRAYEANSRVIKAADEMYQEMIESDEMMLALPILLAVAAFEPGQCQTIDREYLLVRDVAAIVPAFSQLPGDFNLGFAPLSGEPSFAASTCKISRKIAAWTWPRLPTCVSSAGLLFRRAIRFTWPWPPVLGIPKAKIEIVSSSQHAAPSGEVVFPRDGLQFTENQKDLLWRGYVRYGDRYGDDQHFIVWAKVRISAVMTRVVADGNIPAGKPIQAGQVRLETCEDSPLDETTARSLDEVVGLVPKTQLRAAAVIRKTQVDRPPDVARGDLVTVHVFEGAAYFTRSARAAGRNQKARPFWCGIRPAARISGRK